MTEQFLLAGGDEMWLIDPANSVPAKIRALEGTSILEFPHIDVPQFVRDFDFLLHCFFDLSVQGFVSAFDSLSFQLFIECEV